MLALLIDENFDQRILRGLRLRLTNLDYLIVQDIGLGGLDDPALLEWAAREGRVIVTHDVNSMTMFSSERLKQSMPMPGIIIVPEDLEIGRAIDDLRSDHRMQHGRRYRESDSVPAAVTAPCHGRQERLEVFIISPQLRALSPDVLQTINRRDPLDCQLLERPFTPERICGLVEFAGFKRCRPFSVSRRCYHFLSWHRQ